MLWLSIPLLEPVEERIERLSNQYANEQRKPQNAASIIKKDTRKQPHAEEPLELLDPLRPSCQSASVGL